VLIGEIYLPIERLVQYYGVNLGGVDVPFNFQLLLTSWQARDIARIIGEYEAALSERGWPNWVLGNHDRPRIVFRVGPALYYGGQWAFAIRGGPFTDEEIRELKGNAKG
jgi:alpha-glucosidase